MTLAALVVAYLDIIKISPSLLHTVRDRAIIRVCLQRVNMNRHNKNKGGVRGDRAGHSHNSRHGRPWRHSGRSGDRLKEREQAA